MSEIQTREPLGTFLYFFIATYVLATLGANVPFLAKDVGEIMQEHIAGKTICVFAGVTLFLAFLCAVRNVVKPSVYGKAMRYFIVSPSNFVISLAFVAAAVNWGVALSSYVLFPIVARGEVFSFAVRNALQISAIALAVAAVAWALHQSPSVKKTTQPFSSASKGAFWFAFISSAFFWSAFVITLIFKALGAF